MKKVLFASILFALAIPGLASAQALQGVDTLVHPLPTQTERTVADVASWATAMSAIALDAKTSWDSPDRLRAFEMQGLRTGATYGLVFLAKTLVGRERPCAASDSCGIDNPDYSFFSGHTAIAFSTLGGPKWQVALPLAVSTGGLRVAAGKHWLTDVLVGAAVGSLTSRIR